VTAADGLLTTSLDGASPSREVQSLSADGRFMVWALECLGSSDLPRVGARLWFFRTTEPIGASSGHVECQD